METLKRFIKQNPLLAAGIFLAICFGIWFLVGTLWTTARVAYLEHQNANIEKANIQLEKERDELKVGISQRDGVITSLKDEKEKQNALLFAISKKTTATRDQLDRATTDAARIMGDDSELSKQELRDKLCNLYNIPPAACR